MKKKESLFVCVQALVIAVVLALVSLPLASSAPSSCAGQEEVWGPNFGYSNPDGDSTVPALVMQPGQTGYICAVYSFDSTAPNQPSPAANPVFDAGSCNSEGLGIGCSLSPSGSFRIVGKTVGSSSSFDNSTGSFETVIFSVTALQNSTGFYLESAPLSGCASMPLVVGNSASEISASDISDYKSLEVEWTSCIITEYSAVEVGLIGLQFIQLDIGQ